MSYEVYKMNCLSSGSISPARIDGFVFFSTEEDRACNVLEYLCRQNELPTSALALSFDGEHPPLTCKEILSPETELLQILIDNELSGSLLVCLKNIHAYVNGKNVIGIDISCMPTPVFTQILRFLYKKHRDKKIVVYYTEPMHYNLDNLFDFNAYNGEIDIKAIPGFEGKTAQVNETQRMVFYLMGFEMNYLNKLIPQETNPEGIVPINGFPSYFPKYKDISLINNNVNYYERDIEIIFAEANNPFETFNQLNLLRNKSMDYCIDIIPAGTKPMALGACLFALKSGKDDIRILFPFPSEYKNKQTTGKGAVWEYII
jgi:hypothetical protein